MSDLPGIEVAYPHVEVRDDLLSGSPVVRGSRVPVRRLWAWFQKGVAVETLIKRYPALGPAKVLTAIAFALDNQKLMSADLAREAAILDAEENTLSGPQQKLPHTS